MALTYVSEPDEMWRTVIKNLKKKGAVEL